jgi:fucose 4-O-acetylase-like acetyltransferase
MSPASHESRKANRSLARLSGIGILLVVLGHSEGVSVEQVIEVACQNRWYAAFLEIIRWIYTFHMPLFFFLSGWLFHYTNGDRDIRYATFIKAKFLRLIVPYLVLSTVAFPVKVILAKFASRPVAFSVQDFVHQVIFSWHNTIIFFWYLPTLFLMFLAAPFLLRKRMGALHAALLLLASIAAYVEFDNRNLSGPWAFLNVAGALHNFIFFASGFATDRFALSTHVRKCGVFCLPLSVFGFAFCSRDWQLCNLLLALAGIAMCWWLSHQVRNEWLARVGDYSYEIYLFSWFPQRFCRILFGQILQVNVFVAVAAMAVAGLVVPVIVTRVLSLATPAGWRFLYGGSTRRGESGQDREHAASSGQGLLASESRVQASRLP